jgi:2-amino-4-hydroxy-6-hydroxymethyldihydropteridine diphosphokinase
MSAWPSPEAGMTEACLGLGANLGDREASLCNALAALNATPGIRILAASRVFRTAPWGGVTQPDFLNLCVRIETELAPLDLLAACKAVEQLIGRQPRERWGPREMDVDILLMPGAGMTTPELTLPHPRLTERRFVLEPLADIAPDWVVGGQTIAALVAALRNTDPVQDCVAQEVAFEGLKQALGPSINRP